MSVPILRPSQLMNRPALYRGVKVIHHDMKRALTALASEQGTQYVIDKIARNGFSVGTGLGQSVALSAQRCQTAKRSTPGAGEE